MLTRFGQPACSSEPNVCFRMSTLCVVKQTNINMLEMDITLVCKLGNQFTDRACSANQLSFPCVTISSCLNVLLMLMLRVCTSGRQVGSHFCFAKFDSVYRQAIQDHHVWFGVGVQVTFFEIACLTLCVQVGSRFFWTNSGSLRLQTGQYPRTWSWYWCWCFDSGMLFPCRNPLLLVAIFSMCWKAN